MRNGTLAVVRHPLSFTDGVAGEDKKVSHTARAGPWNLLGSSRVSDRRVSQPRVPS